MKHFVVAMLCLFVVSTRLAAHSITDYSPVDKLALNAPAYVGESIETLVAFGKNNTHNDKETVRFYFVWLAQNIHYDSLELAASQRRTSKQDPDTVFLTRKGICRGYADLMALLCQKSNIPARTVSGYSKAIDEPTDTVGFHAWNVIKIDNNWQLFDVTWASNHLEKVKTVDDSFNLYFKQNAQYFIKQHFPFDPVFQLNDTIMTRGAFFFGDTEGVCETLTLPDNFNKILDAEAALSTLEQSLNSYERAVAFIPEERRLYDVLSYFKSEKAQIYFNQATILLDKFRDIKGETIKQWSNKEVKNNIIEAIQVQTLFSQALKLYESMTFIEVNDDTELKKSNMLIIQKNIGATGKLINFLHDVEAEKEKTPLAKM